MTKPLSPRLSADLLDRYFTGQCTPDEAVQVRAALAQNARLGALQQEVDGVSVDVDGVWNRFADSPWFRDSTMRLEAQRETPGVARKYPTSKRSWSRVTQWAGGIAAVSALAAAMVVAVRYQSKPPLAATERVYTTQTGQRATITLADGSSVTLAPATRLVVKSSFGQRARTVTLVGQAYFNVPKSEGVPFIVQTGDIVTRVLGTTFDVKRYPTDVSVRVAVEQGKVQSVGSRAHRQSSPITLSAGMLGTMTDSIATVMSGVDVSTYTGWTQGHLDFKQEPIGSALAMLERWYGLRFQIADSSVLAGTVTGSLDFQRTATALNTLKSLLGVQMTFAQRGDTTVVTLHPRSASTKRIPARRDWQQILNPQMEVGR